MTKIDEKLNKEFQKDSLAHTKHPIKEVYENGELARIYYCANTLTININEQTIDLYGTLNLKEIKLLYEKFKELGWL